METINYLQYDVTKTKNGVTYDIKIRLSDPCKNGHNDFSITAMMYEAGKPKIDKYCIGGGACGETIAKEFPEFAIFDKLHLSDVNGCPMYAISNGWYHLTVTGVEVAANYLRISLDETSYLKEHCKEKELFNYYLLNMGIIDKWKKEANEGIELLEKLTGKKFVDNSTKMQPIIKDINHLTDITEKVKNGYFSPEKMEERANEKNEAIKQKVKSEILDEYNKALQDAKDNYSIQLFILECGIGLNNYIYYSHIKTVSFNWKGYEPKITDEQLNEVLEFSKTYKGYLPENVKFELSKK